MRKLQPCLTVPGFIFFFGSWPENVFSHCRGLKPDKKPWERRSMQATRYDVYWRFYWCVFCNRPTEDRPEIQPFHVLPVCRINLRRMLEMFVRHSDWCRCEIGPEVLFHDFQFSGVTPVKFALKFFTSYSTNMNLCVKYAAAFVQKMKPECSSLLICIKFISIWTRFK